MFADKEKSRTILEQHLRELSRQYPRTFTSVLAVLMAATTILLLLKISVPVVLYQGF